eukprot:353361-Chlamydomonas_euryale.AAC.8
MTSVAAVSRMTERTAVGAVSVDEERRDHARGGGGLHQWILTSEMCTHAPHGCWRPCHMPPDPPPLLLNCLLCFTVRHNHVGSTPSNSESGLRLHSMRVRVTL